MATPPFGGWPPPSASPVTSVFGRIGAVVATLGDYAASLITNDSSVAGATVKDALNNLLAGGGAPVTSVFGRIGAIVATAGDYTSTLVTNVSGVAGANVTAALNALAAAISALTSSSISNASGVTGATVTAALNALNTAISALTSTSISNVSSVTGATVTAALNYLLSNTATLVGRPGWPYLEIPSSPDAWNFEARQLSNPDLAVAGWTITLLDSPWTVLTRSGDVDYTSDVSAGNYRSTLYGGILLLQFPPSAAVFIYKSTTSAAFSYKARVWNSDYASGTSHLVVADGPQRKAGSTRSYYTGCEAGNMLEVLLVAPSTFTVFTTTAMLDNQLDGPREVSNPASGGNMSVQLRDISGRLNLNPGNRTVTITASIAGVSLAAGPRNFCFIDFIRRTPYLAPP